MIANKKQLFTASFLVKLFLLVAVCFELNCTASSELADWEPLPDDTQSIPEPEEVEINILKDAIDKQAVMQLEQALDISRIYRKLANNPKEAKNVDPFGEVQNSTWFTNRNTLKKLSVIEIANGPNKGNGPDVSRDWEIKSAKAEGVTPGFNIKDGRGDRYVIKFEPKGWAELSSGAEIVSGKLFYAAGYNVPENYIVYFNPDILKITEDVSFTDEKGKKRLLRESDLEAIKSKLDIRTDGTVRAIASKFIQGKPIGPFRYEKVRKDDPNDILPHHYRRELRGMRLMAAWLHHYDTKANNSFDAYVSENGKNFVRHYLIDFGSTLGSQASGPKQPHIGFENQFDTKAVLLNILSLGLYVRPYEKLRYEMFPSIGRYSSAYFHPQKYKFIFPNPAFERMTNKDGYWGARLVMSFTDEQIKAVVASAQYSNKEAEDYLVKTMLERRDIIGKYWFAKMNPLDYFELQTPGDQGTQLAFKDLAIETDLENTDNTIYRYVVRSDDTIVKQADIGYNQAISLSGMNVDYGGSLTVSIRTSRDKRNTWSNEVTVFISSIDNASLVLLGINREN